MPSFGETSMERLRTCDSRLQDVCKIVVVEYDISVLCGYRNHEEQQKMFDEGKSKLLPGFSKHNQNPSHAVDIAPYPVDWQDAKRFIYLAGLMMGTARSLGVTLRWGGNWDMDQVIIDDQNFNDLPHFEIIETGRSM